MAVAITVDHVGHRGVVDDGTDQRGSAARDQAVDALAQLHELDGGLAADILDEDEGVGGEASPGDGGTNRGGDGPVRLEGGRGAPQERHVAGLEAQAEGVAGDVGAHLVDDRHDAERDPDL